MKKQHSKEATLKLRQQQILILLNRFRFLKRHQIQTMLNHKYMEKVRLWLNDLTQQVYIHRFYSRRFAGEPAVYCLATKSRGYLKNLKPNKEKGVETINQSLLNRIYREKQLSKTFQTHCMFIADIYLSLLTLVNKNKAKLHFSTKTDLYGMKYLIRPNPDAYFAIEEENGTIKRYFLDIFDELPPRMILRRRIRQYFRYYEQGYWQDHAKKPFPEILLIFPDERSKRYVVRFVKKILENGDFPSFYLSTWQEIQKEGINRQVLHKVE